MHQLTDSERRYGYGDPKSSSHELKLTGLIQQKNKNKFGKPLHIKISRDNSSNRGYLEI